MVDYEYYNVELINNESYPIPAEYLIERTTALLKKADDYKMSIIRFNIPGALIPIFIFQNNEYYVTLRYNSVNYSAVVTYSGNNVTNGEQYVYSYQDFLQMINDAFTAAYTLAHTAGAPINYAPYLTFDSVTQLCTLWVEQLYENTVGVYMNSELYTFFYNFDTINLGYGLANHCDFQFVVRSYQNNVPASRSGFYTFTQEFVSLFYWNDLRSVTFLTASMPINTEAVPSVNSTSGLAIYKPIMTDFQPLQGTGADLRGYLQYQPTIYRYIDLVSESALIKIDLKIFWEDKNQVLRPLYIPPNDIVSVKILFERKNK